MLCSKVNQWVQRLHHLTTLNSTCRRRRWWIRPTICLKTPALETIIKFSLTKRTSHPLVFLIWRAASHAAINPPRRTSSLNLRTSRLSSRGIDVSVKSSTILGWSSALVAVASLLQVKCQALQDRSPTKDQCRPSTTLWQWMSRQVCSPQSKISIRINLTSQCPRSSNSPSPSNRSVFTRHRCSSSRTTRASKWRNLWSRVAARSTFWTHKRTLLPSRWAVKWRCPSKMTRTSSRRRATTNWLQCSDENLIPFVHNQFI